MQKLNLASDNVPREKVRRLEEGVEAEARTVNPRLVSVENKINGSSAKPTANVDETQHVEKITQALQRSQSLLTNEDRFRRAENRKALSFHLLNDPASTVHYDQAYLYDLDPRNKLRFSMAFGTVEVVRDAPMVIELAHFLRSHLLGVSDEQAQSSDGKSRLFSLKTGANEYPTLARSHFKEALWVPLTNRDGEAFAGICYLRHSPWQENDRILLERTVSAGSHAWIALGAKRLRPSRFKNNWLWTVITFALIAACFIPVTLTVLAPFEVTARNPSLVTAPIDGTINTVIPQPNTWVLKGDDLFEFDNTDLRNQLALSERRLAVTGAQRRRLELSAINDVSMKAELAAVIAEQELALAERDYAQSQLDRGRVVANVSGLLMYSAKKDWVGKAVQTGERIMQIADPKRTELTISLPLGEAIAAQEGLPVVVFPNADPTSSADASLSRVSRTPVRSADGQMVYELTAQFVEATEPPPLGYRGIARVELDKVRLFYFVFRKPMAFLRQYFGL